MNLQIQSPRRAALLAIVLTICLGGCYLPVRFDAEIEVDRRGYYSMIFDGYLAKVPLYADLRQNKISIVQEKERVEQVKSDLVRDTSTKEFEYLRKGLFKLHWEKDGDLLKAKFISFLRRNENMLSVMYVDDSRAVTIQGAAIADNIAKQLREIGLTMEGNIRVITDAKVVSHNAADERAYPKKGPKFKMYTWRLKSLDDPTPKMLIVLQ